MDATADARVVYACGEQLANALQALHEAQVVHRDLKSGNVIVGDDQRPVLVDFGIARVPRSKIGSSNMATNAIIFPRWALCSEWANRGNRLTARSLDSISGPDNQD